MNFLTKEELKDFLGKYPENDELVEQYCNAAMEMIANFLGYNPEATEYVTERYGDNGRLFELDAFPLIELISVTANGFEVTKDLFRIKNKNYLEYNFGRGVFDSETLYKITYKAGFEEVPSKIKSTAAQIASLIWESSGGNLAVSSTSFADTGTRQFNNFTADRFLKELEPYTKGKASGF